MEYQPAGKRIAFVATGVTAFCIFVWIKHKARKYVDNSLVGRYLERLKLTNVTRSFLKRQSLSSKRSNTTNKPSLQELSQIVDHHCRHVPFENLDLHDHSATGEYPYISIQNMEPGIKHVLSKIVDRNRGGWCYEINFACCWLLRQLGYTVRLCRSQIARSEGYLPFPTHCALLVDIPHSDDGTSDNNTYFVDPGLGDSVRSPLPVVCGASPVKDLLGDEYIFLRGKLPTKLLHWSGKPTLDLVVLRKRAKSIPRHIDWIDGFVNPDQSQFFAIHRMGEKGLKYSDVAFNEGIACTLKGPNMFTKKKICAVGLKDGHMTLCQNRIKFVRNGEVQETFFPDDQHEHFWRDALKEYFNIILV